jgi:hypothetical protein
MAGEGKAERGEGSERGEASLEGCKRMEESRERWCSLGSKRESRGGGKRREEGKLRANRSGKGSGVVLVEEVRRRAREVNNDAGVRWESSESGKVRSAEKRRHGKKDDSTGKEKVESASPGSTVRSASSTMKASLLARLSACKG